MFEECRMKKVEREAPVTPGNRRSERFSRAAFRLLSSTLLLLAVLGAPSPVRAEQARHMAPFLVDLARDHGLIRSGRQTPADAQQIRVMLNAALRFDPQNAEALELLYDLHSRAGDEDRAVATLERIAAADPRNEAAVRQWLETGARPARTLEQQREWLERQLQTLRTDAARAVAHVRLAQLALHQVDEDRFQEHIAAARRIDPSCPDVDLLVAEVLVSDLPAGRHAAVLLAALRWRPNREDYAFAAALALDRAGCSEEAHRLFQHAGALHQLRPAVAAVGAEALIAFSRNAAARGALDTAMDYAMRAARRERLSLENSHYVLWLYRRYGATSLADLFAQQFAEMAAQYADVDEYGLELAGQAAWHYCLLEARPERALQLADTVLSREPDHALARRARGWALAGTGRAEEAAAVLEPLIERDAYAAYTYARLLHDRGDADAPARILRALHRMPVAGFARDLWEELIPSAGGEGAWRSAEAVDALKSFPWEVLHFALEPQVYVAAEIAPMQATVRVGEPWVVDFTLGNRAPFPILLGPDAVVNPVLLVSVRAEGDKLREYPNLLVVSLDRKRRLAPGESVTVRRTLDVGPLRRISRLTPQQMQRITVAALLDPAQAPDGYWRPGPSGLSLRPGFLQRLAVTPSNEALAAMDAALARGQPSERIRAVETMAALLGEQQRAAHAPPNYQLHAVSTERLRRRLLDALEGGSWELRVRTLDALSAAGLDSGMVRAAEACLRHEHWLVRMMAVRLLSRQGATFAQTAEHVAQSDADPLVRELASGYAERLRAAARDDATDGP